MISVHDISIQFGEERVFEHLSCEVKRGDFACITGVSGCGKSSLLKALIGLVPIGGGDIRICGHDMNEKTCNIVRRAVMYLPQELSFPSETINEFVAHIQKVGRVKDVHKSIKQLYKNLSLLGLEKEILDKRMSEISGGQRQRLMLATLALLDRELWLLDEPTAALDEASRDLVINFLRTKQQDGKTIVAVSHDVCFASHCSTLIQLG
ncbi:MAG: ABC transporter ATP-binding protein [Bacteroidaceae bacterium]|nr:ABC transporter ATP-binding protein [Bacteroidaceae bacterium]